MTSADRAAAPEEPAPAAAEPPEESGPGSAGGDDPDERAPVGTLFFLVVYLMVLVGMWATMYWLLVTR